MDRIDAMQAFVAVADLHGFAPAARKLGLSPSGVTRLIAALEDRLGARLLQRTTRSVTLTDVGARYLEGIRRILADVEEAEAAAEGERTRPSGRLVVSAPIGFGRLHVSPVMSAYLMRYPEVLGELRLSDRMINLVEDGVDLAIRIGHLADSTLVARHVGEMRRIVVASSGYLKRRGEPETPEAIASHATIQFGATTASPDWRFVEDGREVSVACAPRFTTNSADAAIQYAEQGGGLTRVLAYQAAEAIKAGRLRIVLEKFEPPPLPIHIVYPTSRLLSAKVRTFIDLDRHKRLAFRRAVRLDHESRTVVMAGLVPAIHVLFRRAAPKMSCPAQGRA
jgi:DNA-binding transcriptional LysR family regulator